MGQPSAACEPTIDRGNTTGRHGNKLLKQRQRQPEHRLSAVELPSRFLSAQQSHPPLRLTAPVHHLLVVSVLFIYYVLLHLQESDAVQKPHGGGRLPLTRWEHTFPMGGAERSLNDIEQEGLQTEKEESVEEAASDKGSAHMKEESRVKTTRAEEASTAGAASLIGVVQPSSSSWSPTVSSASGGPSDISVAATASVSGAERVTHAASTLSDWPTQAPGESAIPSTQIYEGQHEELKPRERRDAENEPATTFEDATTSLSDARMNERLLAPAGGDIATPEEHDTPRAATTVEPVVEAGAAAESSRHNSSVHSPHPGSSNMFRPRSPIASGVVNTPSDVTAAVRRSSFPAAALLTPITGERQQTSRRAENKDTSQRNKSGNDGHSSIKRTAATGATTGGAALHQQATRQQPIRRHHISSEQAEPSNSSAEISASHVQQERTRGHVRRRQSTSTGATAMLSPVSSAYDRDYEDENEEDMGLTNAQGFGQRLREAISCPASKILIGIGGAVAIGVQNGSEKLFNAVNEPAVVAETHRDELLFRTTNEYNLNILPWKWLHREKNRKMHSKSLASKLQERHSYDHTTTTTLQRQLDGIPQSVGTLGVKYTRALLKRRRRQKLQQRPPTPFSDLLGHILLAHDEQQATAAAESGEGGVLCSAKERWVGGGRSSSRIVEAATADVLGDPGSVTALYFTSIGVEEMLQERGYLPFTTKLEAIAAGCKRRGQKLQVVYVSADADSRDAAKHFAQMPWYAVPYDDAEGQEIAQRLYRRFRVSTLPHVVLLDSEARVINPQAYASMLMEPAAFPWRKKSLRELLGDTLIRPDGNKVDKSALDNKILGLYFSASWCSPCQAFTPNLVNAARVLKEQGKNFEVVFISNDKNQQQFDEYFKKMDSFLAVPFKDTNKRAVLQEMLNVRSLPTLVWVGPDDEILTRSGVAALSADAELKTFPFKEPDVHEVADTVEGIAQEPALILFMEYADQPEQQKQEAALEAAAAALKGQKRDGGFPPVPLLFTAKKISPRSAALRRICKQNEAFGSGDLRAARQQQAPVMVIVDLIDQSYYLYKRPATTATVEEASYFTADEIVNFVREFRSETLERNSLVLPE